MSRAGLYGLFFISGLTALIYELAWQRLLHLVFGVSTLSISAVLAAFMGGLALGGILFGRCADRTGRPLGIYAWLEAGIGLAGLLVLPGFGMLTTIYTAVYAALAPSQWGGVCLRFGLAFLVLAVPTTCIGGTVPIMARLAWRRTIGLPTAFSLFYAMNTLGAVLGAALTGFVLLRYLGMHGTLWLAAGLNFFVALAAGLASKRASNAHSWAGEERRLSHGPWVGFSAAGDSSSPDGTSKCQCTATCPWLALGCAGLIGIVGMGFEVIWMRILGILTSNSAYGFALMLTVLLLGLGLGSLLQWSWSHVQGDSWRRLATCQWLLAGISAATFSFLHTTPGWLEHWCDGSSITRVFVGELALTSGAVFLPAVLMGMTLPLLVAGVTSDSAQFGEAIGRIYAVNTLGGVAGAFLTGFILIRWLGIHSTTGLMVGATLAVSMIAWGKVPGLGRPGRLWAGGTMLLAAAVVWSFWPPGPYLKSAVKEPRRLLFYKEGDNATVSVVQEYDGTRRLLVDGQPVAGTAPSSVVDQKMLAHLPLLLHPAPRRALTVGFGSGGTSFSMILHGIDVDCVEIEAAVPAAAKLFQSENHNVLAHPRFHLIVDDARSWLRVAPLRYDVIVTDCTNIQYRSNGDLYTVDYFHLLKRRLTANGLAAAWVPTNCIQDADLKTLIRSFHAVFPHTSIWYMNSLPTDFLILVGTPGVLDIELDHFRQRMLAQDVYQDLQTAGLADPARLVYTFVAGDNELPGYLGTGPLNTDDRPLLSYTTYGATFAPTAAGNLIRLLACRGDVSQFVRHAAATDLMLRHYAASNDLVLGHIAYLVGCQPAALAYYLKSARLLPGDAALRELLRAVYCSP